MSGEDASASTSKQNLKRKSKNSNVASKKLSKISPIEASNIVAERDEDADKNDFLSNLPNEILEKILKAFSFDDLFTLERVNKSFREIALKVGWPRKERFDHETIIKYTKYQYFKKGLSSKQKNLHRIAHQKSVEAILSRANIKYLDLSLYYRKVGASICSMLNMAPQMIELDLSNIELKKESLNNVAQFCPLLEKLTLEGCITKKETEKGLIDIYIQCKNLKYLNLSKNHLGNSFEYIPSQLLYLNLANCNDIHSDPMFVLAEKAINLETLILDRYYDRTDFNKWLKNLTNLRFFEFNNNDSNHISFPSIDLSHNKNLEMVCFIQNKGFTTQSLEFLQKCPKIKALNIKHICGENHNWQRKYEILKNFRNIKYCKFECVSSFGGLIDFIQSSQIQYLSINDGHDLKDEAIKSIITECNSLTHFELHQLNLNYNGLLMEILSEENLQRSNTLKLVIDKKGDYVFPPCEWCEIHFCSGTSPFDDFTDVRKQFFIE